MKRAFSQREISFPPFWVVTFLALVLGTSQAAWAGPATPPISTDPNQAGAILRPPPPASAEPAPRDPPKLGEKPSAEEAAANRERCRRADHIIDQANKFEDESPIAIKYFEQALEICPSHPKGNFRLGVIAYHQKNRDAAIKSFERAIQNDSNFVDAHYNLAIIYRHLNKPKESRENFEKAVGIAPNDALSLYNLGVLQIRDLERNKALATFRQAVTADPKLAEAHFFLGALLQEQGQKKSAKNELGLAIQLNPQLALPRVFISAILESDGEATRAKDELNKALSLNKAALNIGYGYEDFYFKEGKGNDILSRVREKPKAPLPPKLASRVAPGEPGAPEKEESFGPKREAREMPVESKPEPSDDTPPAPPPKKIQPTAASRNYRVRRGDTLSKIALRHRTNLDTLIRLNLDRIEHPSVLEVGNLIRVPASRNGRAFAKPQKTVKRKRGRTPKTSSKRGRAARYLFHRVRPGDTLGKIAAKYKISLDSLIRFNRNRVEHPSIINVGDLVRVPARKNKR